MTTKSLGVRLGVKGGNAVAKDLDKIGKVGDKAFKKVEISAKGAGGQLSNFDRAAKRVNMHLSKTSLHTGFASTGIRGLAIAAGVAVAGIGLLTVGMIKAVKIGREAAQAFSDIELNASEIGLNTDEYQELSYAALNAGISQDVFASSMKRANRHIEEARQGVGETRDVLKKYKIELNDVNGNARDNADIMRDVAEAMKNMTSEAEKSYLAYKLFDEEGAQMVNMLKKGGDAFDDMRKEAHAMGLVIDEALIKRGREAARQADILSQIIDVNLKSAFVDLAPVINDVMELFADFARGVADIADAFRDLENMTLRGQTKVNNATTDAYAENAKHLDRLKTDLVDVNDKQRDDWFGNKKQTMDDLRDEISLLENKMASQKNDMAKFAKTYFERVIKPKKTPNDEAGANIAEMKKADQWVKSKLSGFRDVHEIYAQDRNYINGIYKKKLIDKAEFDALMLGLDKQYKDKIAKTDKKSPSSKEFNKRLLEAKKLYLDSLTPMQKYAEYERKIMSIKPAMIALLGDEAKAMKVLDAALIKKHDEILPDVASAMRKIADEAGNMGAQISDAIGGAFSGLEDEIVNVLLNAKSPAEALSSLLLGIGEDLLRIGIKGAITNPASDWLATLTKAAIPQARRVESLELNIPQANVGTLASPRHVLNSVSQQINAVGVDGVASMLNLTKGSVPIGVGSTNSNKIELGGLTINIDGAGDAAEVARLAAHEVERILPSAINNALEDAMRPGGSLNRR